MLRKKKFFHSTRPDTFFQQKLAPLGSSNNPFKLMMRTPITQLNPQDKQIVLEISRYQQDAITRLKTEGLHIDRFEHEVRGRSEQLSSLEDTTKITLFKKGRLGGLLRAHMFEEIFFDTSLSVSGGVEHGYYRAYLKQHQVYSEATKRRMCSEWQYITPLVEGGCFLTVFVGSLPTTTLYKADPFTVPILLIDKKYNHVRPDDEEIKKTLPNAILCEGVEQLTEIYPVAYRRAKELITHGEQKKLESTQIKPEL